MNNTQNSASSTQSSSSSTQQSQTSILGLPVDQLAGLSVDELTGNKTAITMVMHYYKQLTDENTALKNERNTLSTYVTGYNQKKSDTRIGAALMAMSNVFLGFGVNFLTGDTPQSPSRYGVGLFICGIIMLTVGLYFSLRDAD